MNQSLTPQLVRLQAKMYARHLGFRRNEMSRRAMHKDLASFLAAARRTGHVELLYSGSRLRAALLLAKVPLFYAPKKLAPNARVLVLGDDAPAMRWMKGRLRQHCRYFSKHSKVQIDANCAGLLKILADQCGLHLHTAILAGEPRESLRALRKRYGNLSWDQVPGLRIDKVRTRAQVRQVIAITRREFKRNPQFGNFIASPEFLARERTRLLAECRKRNGSYLILDSRGKVWGEFGMQYRPGGRVGVPNGGIWFTFDRRLQGKGLARFAYATLLERMLELKIKIYLGGTSQKPVLKLARLMGRRLFEYGLQGQKAYFPRHYFRYPSQRGRQLSRAKR